MCVGLQSTFTHRSLEDKMDTFNKQAEQFFAELLEMKENRGTEDVDHSVPPNVDNGEIYFAWSDADDEDSEYEDDDDEHSENKEDDDEENNTT